MAVSDSPPGSGHSEVALETAQAPQNGAEGGESEYWLQMCQGPTAARGCRSWFTLWSISHMWTLLHKHTQELLKPVTSIFQSSECSVLIEYLNVNGSPNDQHKTKSRCLLVVNWLSWLEFTERTEKRGMQHNCPDRPGESQKCLRNAEQNICGMTKQGAIPSPNVCFRSSCLASSLMIRLLPFRYSLYFYK